VKFIAQHKKSIIAEILEMLKAEPEEEFVIHSRWGEWESAVLSRVPSPQDCQALIRQRQSDLDVEQEESGMLQDYIERQLSRNQVRLAWDKVFITNSKMAEWANDALGERHGKVSACKLVTQKINEGRLTRLHRAENAERIDGETRRERGFWWIGEMWKESDGKTIRPAELKTHDIDDDWTFEPESGK
jgi:hypothetical protein